MNEPWQLIFIVGSQFSDNTPPVMWIDRNLVLLDSEPVGSVVTRARAEDNEQDQLTYGLEPLGHNYNGNENPQPSLPFFIDNSTGIIYVNETLKDKVNVPSNPYLNYFHV